MSNRTTVLLTMLILGPTASQATSIDWVHDIPAGFAQAREANKPILIDFWASWCGPCRAMDAEFWSRQDVRRLARQFVMIRAESGGLIEGHGTRDSRRVFAETRRLPGRGFICSGLTPPRIDCIQAFEKESQS